MIFKGCRPRSRFVLVRGGVGLPGAAGAPLVPHQLGPDLGLGQVIHRAINPDRLGMTMAIPAGFAPDEYLVLEDTASYRHEFCCGLVYAMAGGSTNHRGCL